MQRSYKNKWMILIAAAFFLLITSCSTAPTAEEKEMSSAGPGKFDDITGMWKQIDDWEGCGFAKIDTWMIKITQEGNKITYTNVDRNHTTQGIRRNDILALKGYSYDSRYGGTTTIYDFNLKISPDGNISQEKLGGVRLTVVKNVKVFLVRNLPK